MQNAGLSLFGWQVTKLASEAKREKNSLTKEITKISNFGISVWETLLQHSLIECVNFSDEDPYISDGLSSFLIKTTTLQFL